MTTEKYEGMPNAYFAIDFADNGKSITTWYCTQCGIANYPCNCLKEYWRKLREEAKQNAGRKKTV